MKGAPTEVLNINNFSFHLDFMPRKEPLILKPLPLYIEFILNREIKRRYRSSEYRSQTPSIHYAARSKRAGRLSATNRRANPSPARDRRRHFLARGALSPVFSVQRECVK